MSEDKTIVLDNSNADKIDYGRCPVCNSPLNPDQSIADLLRCPMCHFSRKQEFSFAPGSIVCNKYRILSHLNSGGCGDIFLCHPLDDMQTRYVLKILKNATTTNKKRFRREISILSSIQNITRITRIYDCWESEDCIFIIMEYVNGQNLHQLQKQYCFDEISSLTIAREVIIGLKYIWENHSIIHRDIKPENLMLDESFCLKILDFGLSKQYNADGASTTMNITIEKSCLGTPGFMSPEQFRDSKNVDFRTDIFSLGATIFYLLTGQKPFNGTNPAAIFNDTLDNSPPPVERFESKCSSQCIAIVRKMMQGDPDKRYCSYDELLTDIDQLLQQD